MSSTNEMIECPICYDCIGDKNNITTECGHQFHASCIMTNISRNGFSCPCCRTLMANDVEEGDPEDDERTLIDEGTLLDESNEPFSEDALRGLRLLTNVLENQDHDIDDLHDEYHYTGFEPEDEQEGVPSVDYIVNGLTNQGITYKQLVAWILIDHDEYDDMDLENISGNVWSKIRMLFSNYHEEEVVEEDVEEDVVEEEVVNENVVVEEEVVVEDMEPEFNESPILDENEDDDYNIDEETEYDIEFAEGGGFYLKRRRSDVVNLFFDCSAEPKTPICV